MNCPYSRQPITPGVLMCPHCGANLRAGTAASAKRTWKEIAYDVVGWLFAIFGALEIAAVFLITGLPSIGGIITLFLGIAWLAKWEVVLGLARYVIFLDLTMRFLFAVVLGGLVSSAAGGAGAVLAGIVLPLFIVAFEIFALYILYHDERI
jgi:hypothetical protein